MKERVVCDLSGHHHVFVRGADRVRFINGLCTSDVSKLSVDDWQRTCFLNPKGRILSIAEVVACADELWLMTDAGQGEALVAHLQSHAIMDDVEIAVRPQAAYRIWLGPADVWTAKPIVAQDAPPASSAVAIETWRIEAGLPKYGIDATDQNFPFESLLEQTIDYQKGCYIGQEPVARVRYKGQPQKQLRGLLIEGPVAPGADVSSAGKKLSQLTSVAESPRLGTIGLAYLDRAHQAPNTSLRVGDANAVVVNLPFG